MRARLIALAVCALLLGGASMRPSNKGPSHANPKFSGGASSGGVVTSTGTVAPSFTVVPLTMTPASPDLNVLLAHISTFIPAARAIIPTTAPLYWQGADSILAEMETDTVSQSLLDWLGGSPRDHQMAISVSWINNSSMVVGSAGSLPTGCLGRTYLNDVCATAIKNTLVAWVPRHMQAGDTLIVGNEYNDCFETGQECAGSEAAQIALFNDIRTALTAAGAADVKMAPKFAYTVAKEAKITALTTGLHADQYGFTVYGDSYDCSAPAGVTAGAQSGGSSLLVNNLNSAQTYATSKGWDWLIAETGSCSSPLTSPINFSGSVAEQATTAKSIVAWRNGRTGAQASHLKWISVFIAMDGFYNDAAGCQRFGTDLKPYICSLGVFDAAGVAKSAASNYGWSSLGGSAACGDRVIQGSEACDDGNTTAGDGCSATCTVEGGHTCTCSGISCVVGMQDSSCP